jgi:hypothetical protein
VKRLRDLVLLALFSMLLHLPFLDRPVHSDEVNYLDMAANVFDHPATPLNFTYVFMGLRVDMIGHPHLPLNAYMLAALWAARGQVSIRLFHAVYLVFPLTIAWAAYFIAARYTKHPMWVAMLVAAAPVVQVPGNSIETDTPALAFLLAGAAFFLARRFLPAAILFTLAGFTALQTLPVVAILLADYWLRRERPPVAAWAAAATPFLAVGAWQVGQFLMIGRLPAAKLAGYAAFPAFSTLQAKRNSVIVLVEHLGAMVVFAPFRARLRQWIPALLLAVPSLLLSRDYAWWERAMLFGFVALGVETLIWLGNRVKEQPLLALWCLGYLLFTFAAFFAGAARYLMPLAVPLVILFVWQNESNPRRLKLALGISLFLGLNLSFADYELARVHSELPPPPGKDFLVDGEWGFRYHMVRLGGHPLERQSEWRPGQWIVGSEMAVGAHYLSQAELTAVPQGTLDLKSRTPFRVIDRYAHSGFESAGFGLLPFSFSWRPIDRITYAVAAPVLDVPGWLPTRFDDHLVFVATPGAEVTVYAGPRWKTCRVSLFARGQGEASFLAPPFLGLHEKVDGEFLEPEEFQLGRIRQFTFQADASPGVRVGWQDLACY